MFKVRLFSSIVLMILMLFFVISGGNFLLAATAFLSLSSNGIYEDGKNP